MIGKICHLDKNVMMADLALTAEDYLSKSLEENSYQSLQHSFNIKPNDVLLILDVVEINIEDMLKYKHIVKKFDISMFKFLQEHKTVLKVFSSKTNSIGWINFCLLSEMN
jgi:hypothetical protein